MTLIVTKPKRPLWRGRHAEGMTNTLDIREGAPPPWIAPHCSKCRLPVERFTVDWIASPHYVAIQYQCHGRTGGTRVSREEVLYKAAHGGAVWVFKESPHG